MGAASISRNELGHLELWKDGEVQMSEYHIDMGHYDEIITRSRGDVLMLGLGLGSINEKLDYNVINSVDIVELYQDVIDLSSEYPKTTIIKADARTYKTDKMYDVIWIDIWTGLDIELLPDMNQMLDLWQKNLKPGGWMECFFRQYLLERLEQGASK